jgi:hypothetical protein
MRSLYLEPAAIGSKGCDPDDVEEALAGQGRHAIDSLAE